MLWMCNKVIILSHCQLYTCVYSVSGNQIGGEGGSTMPHFLEAVLPSSVTLM